MTDAAAQSLLSQLAIYRATLADLLRQAGVYGGESLAPISQAEVQ